MSPAVWGPTRSVKASCLLQLPDRRHGGLFAVIGSWLSWTLVQKHSALDLGALGQVVVM